LKVGEGEGAVSGQLLKGLHPFSVVPVSRERYTSTRFLPLFFAR
jgi:hypothetical protein